jgi:transcription elongation factor Elf1
MKYPLQNLPEQHTDTQRRQFTNSEGRTMPSPQLGLKCPKCGSEGLKVVGNPKPNDMVTCGECGTNTRYAVVQASAIKASKEANAKALRDAFGKTRF